MINYKIYFPFSFVKNISFLSFEYPEILYCTIDYAFKLSLLKRGQVFSWICVSMWVTKNLQCHLRFPISYVVLEELEKVNCGFQNLPRFYFLLWVLIPTSLFIEWLSFSYEKLNAALKAYVEHDFPYCYFIMVDWPRWVHSILAHWETWLM